MWENTYSDMNDNVIDICDEDLLFERMKNHFSENAFLNWEKEIEIIAKFFIAYSKSRTRKEFQTLINVVTYRLKSYFKNPKDGELIDNIYNKIFVPMTNRFYDSQDFSKSPI